MIYNQLSIENDDIVALNSRPSLSGVYIFYNNSGLHDYMPSWPFYSPTPVIDITYAFNKNEVDIPDTITTSVNLQGIIYHKQPAPPIKDQREDPLFLNNPSYIFSQLINGMNNLRKIFTNEPFGTLEIASINPQLSKPIVLHKIDNITLKDISFDQTTDNWTKSIQYTISLESTKSLYHGDSNIEKYVTDRTHTWNIEPIEDIYYVNNNISTQNKQKRENYNPNINNIDPTNNPLAIKDFQQFRVTRKLSAKGIIPPLSKIEGSKLLDANSRPYVFAKAWVEKMSNTFKIDNTNYSSAPYFLPVFNSGSISRHGSSFPFDHKRTVNVDIFDGTYSVDDSWLVLPRANPYIETYTVESSSDDSFTKTVTVAGDIIGLSIYQDPLNIMVEGTGVSGLLPTNTTNVGSLLINLDASIKNQGLSTPGSSVTTLSSNNNYGSLDTNTSNRNSIYRSKYENALSGWLYDVKPYLYRRASIAINTEDRSFTYIRNQNPPNATRPPHNPVYCTETLLSVVPIGATENHDPSKGTINYSYEFNNRFNIFSGVIKENISLSYDNSFDNITETSTLDPSKSSFIQRQNRSNPKKSINVEISIPPVSKIEQVSMHSPQCPLFTGNYLWSAIDLFIRAHAPYSTKTFQPGVSWSQAEYAGLNTFDKGLSHETSDSETWNPTAGQYSRNYSWIYQPHTITNHHREH